MPGAGFPAPGQSSPQGQKRNRSEACMTLGGLDAFTYPKSALDWTPAGVNLAAASTPLN
jgi:hypothetical protein